jgi:hypothetical protein
MVVLDAKIGNKPSQKQTTLEQPPLGNVLNRAETRS